MILFIISLKKELGSELKKVISFLYILLLLTNLVFSQDTKLDDVNKLFIKIEEGLNNNAVDKFANYFSNKNFISLSNGNSGYYSANQSYYVIKDFLSVFQPISFKLTNIVIDTTNPFASGILKYNNKGIRGTALVFISLQFIDNKWRISQITIN